MARPGRSARSVLRGGARRRRAKKRRRIEVATPRGRGRSRRGRPLAGKADGGGACPPTLCPDKADKARDAGGGATGLGGKAASGAVMASWGQSEGEETSSRHRRGRREKEQKGCVTPPNGEGGKVNSDENDAAAGQNGRRRSPPQKTRTFPRDGASSTTRARPREGANVDGEQGRPRTARKTAPVDTEPAARAKANPNAGRFRRSELPSSTGPSAPPPRHAPRSSPADGEKGGDVKARPGRHLHWDNELAGARSAGTPTTKRKGGATHPGRCAGLRAAPHMRPRRRRRRRQRRAEAG